MKPLFRHSLLQTRFEKDGYLQMPFFDASEVAALNRVYEDFRQDAPPHFYSTSFLPDPDVQQAITDSLTPIFAPRVEELFKDYKPLGCSFLIKPAGPQGFMPNHQDWTVSDEAEHCTVTIWVPLKDTTVDNGCIKVLRGGHRLNPALRGPTIPTMIDPIDELITAEMSDIPLRAGEAFIFNHATLHGSHLNNGTEDRVAVTFGLTQKSTQLVYYFMDGDVPEGKAEKFKVKDNFFQAFPDNKIRPADSEPDGLVDLVLNPLTETDFDRWEAERDKPIPMAKKQLFKNAEQEAQFQEKGWVLVDLLDEAEIKELLEFYHARNDHFMPDYGFHVTLDNQDPDYKRKLDDKIRAVTSPKMDDIFVDYKILVNSYVVKEPHPQGIVPTHQDWTFVDEKEYSSVTVWTPLLDVNMDNGALGVIHGSNKFFDHVRCSPSPQARTPLDEHLFSIMPYVDIMNLKAGQALIFNNATIHASTPNVTDQARIGVGVGVTNKEAQLYHYYLVPGTDKQKLEVFEVDEEFFHKYSNGKLGELYDKGERPEGYKSLGIIDNPIKPLTQEEMLAKIKAVPENKINGELIAKMAALFNYNMDGSKKEEAAERETAVEEPTPEPVEAAAENGNGNGGAEEKWVWEDDRSFWQKYTPANILTEIGIKLGLRKQNN